MPEIHAPHRGERPAGARLEGSTEGRLSRPHGQEFIDLAQRGINTGRSYIATLWRVILYPMGFAVVTGLAAGAAAALGRQMPEWGGQTVAVIGQFGSIVLAGLVVVWSVQRCHRRPWLTLVTAAPWIDWRRLAIGVGAELAIVVGQFALIHLVSGLPWRFAIPATLPLVMLTLLLIPLQAASE